MNATFGSTVRGVVLIGLLSAGAAQAAESTQSGLSEDGRDFIVEAAKGNAGEVELGKVAADKGQAESVREYGKRLATDHGEANDRLRKVADEAGVSWPSAGTEEQRELMDDLSDLSGAEFDERFMEAMVKDHKKDIEKYEEMSEDASYPPLKAYVQSTLPKLKEHLTLAEKVNDSL